MEAAPYMQDSESPLFVNTPAETCTNGTNGTNATLCISNIEYLPWPWFMAELYLSYPYGAVQFYPFVVVLGILFVTYYLDVWNVYRQNRNRGWTNRRVSTSGSGFRQLLKDFTTHLRDKSVVGSAITQSLLLVISFWGVSVLVYLGVISIIPTQVLQSSLVVTALLMIFLAVAGLVILRPNVEAGRAKGPLDYLLLVALLGTLCDLVVNVIVCGLGLQSRYWYGPVVGIFEQTLWMFQSVLQVALIRIALQKEGRYAANRCCGSTPLKQVLDTLTVLNFGMLQKATN